MILVFAKGILLALFLMLLCYLAVAIIKWDLEWYKGIKDWDEDDRLPLVLAGVACILVSCITMWLGPWGLAGSIVLTFVIIGLTTD